MSVVARLDQQGNPTARNLRTGSVQTGALPAPQFDDPSSGQLATRLADGLEVTGRHLVVHPGRAQIAGVVLELLDLRTRERATGVPSLERRPPVDVVSRRRLVTRQSSRRRVVSTAW